MINLRAVTLVAEREIRQQARGRALWLSTAITVIAVVLVIVLPHELSSGPTTYRIAVSGSSSSSARASIEAAAASLHAHVQILVVPDRAAAVAALTAKGAAHADISVDVSAREFVIVDRAFSPTSTDKKALLAQTIAVGLASARAVANSGLSAHAVQALIHPAPVPIAHLRPAPGGQTKRTVALVGAIVFYLLVLRYGIGLMMGVVQEKSTRVIEVILSALRPVDLLAGKVVGSSVIVFLQGALLVGAALISAHAIGSDVLAGSGAAAILVAGVWIVIGFLLYAAMFTAAGALATRSEDVQSVSLPIQIPLFLGYFTSFTAVGSGAPSGLLKVLAYVPFTAPMDMPVLVSTGGAGTTQVLMSMFIAVATIVITLRAATVIFGRSILRTGQRVKIRKLLKEARLAGVGSPHARRSPVREHTRDVT